MLCFTSIVGNSTSKESMYDTSAITCLNIDILTERSLKTRGLTIFLSSNIFLLILPANFWDNIFKVFEINSILFIKSYSSRKYVMMCLLLSLLNFAPTIASLESAPLKSPAIRLLFATILL